MAQAVWMATLKWKRDKLMSSHQILTLTSELHELVYMHVIGAVLAKYSALHKYCF